MNFYYKRVSYLKSFLLYDPKTPHMFGATFDQNMSNNLTLHLSTDIQIFSKNYVAQLTFLTSLKIVVFDDENSNGIFVRSLYILSLLIVHDK